MASEAGLKVSFNSKYSDTVEAGEVFRQSISSGTKVSPGSTISLTISLGKQEVKVRVQDFTGMSKADAQELAGQIGVVLRPVEKYSEEAEGLVYEQDVAAGTEVKEGTVITIYISKGKEPVTEYKGTVTITEEENPFIEGEYEAGSVTVTMVQGETEKVIFEGELNYKSFPKTITFTSTSSETAQVYVTVDGERIEHSWNVTMEQE